MTIEESKLKDYDKLFNDIIKYVIDNVCDYFKIKHFDNFNIIRLNINNFIINDIIYYDYYNDIFKYKDEVLNFKIYQPEFKGYIYEIFKEIMDYETYNGLDINKLYIIIGDFEEYYEMGYELKGEIWADKMIRDFYKMMN